MIKITQKLLKITAALVIGSVTLWSCESEADQLGSQFFQNGAEGITKQYPIVGYNIDNHDTIRTDANKLQNATLGAFKEDIFGLQKVDFYSQVRLSQYSPDFGRNPVLDSAILVLNPQYAADSAIIDTDENYIYPIGNIPAKKVVKKFPIVKYGKSKINGNTIFNIKVEEVTQFLSSRLEQVRSNKIVATGGVIGTKIFDGSVRETRVYKDTDESVLFDLPVGLRIPLSKTFISNKILSKGSAPELLDAASFIRYFKGIKISVVENDGYIFSFDPNNIQLTLYYKKDKTEAGVTTRVPAEYSMDLSSLNAKFSTIAYERAGTPVATAMASITPIDEINGVKKLFAQGMGGPGFALKVPDHIIDSLKTSYTHKKIGIISAKLRIHTDGSWNSNYKKPTDFVVAQKDLNGVTLNTYLQDMYKLSITGVYRLVKGYDLKSNNAFYDIGITETLKSIIEQNSKNPAHFVVNVGDYTVDEAGNLEGSLAGNYGAQNFNTRSFTPARIVLTGTDPNNAKNAQLIVTYGVKKN